MKKKFHFIGIGGIGMSALARLLLKRKATVSGSDNNTNKIIDTLKQLGADINLGHRSDLVSEDAAVVYSSAVKCDNPEYQEAKNKNCSLLHRSDLLNYLMEGYKPLTVAGTHGKTTTSSLLTYVLLSAGKEPSYAIGGVLLNEDTNSNAGKGEYFVAEADESDGTFLKYSPYAMIVTNIGSGDHIDNYGSQDALTDAYVEFLGKIDDKDRIFYCADDDRLKNLNVNGISYGFGEGLDLRVSNYRQEGWHTFFDIEYKGIFYRNIKLALVGAHNVLNSLAVWGLAHSLGVEEAEIRKGFCNFKGVGRRCEKKGEIYGIEIYDDYAHHPAEIKTTLSAIKAAIGSRRLVVLFQPHRYTRTKECLAEYRGAFDTVDALFVTDVYSAGEEPLEGVSPEAVIKKSGHLHASYVARENISTKAMLFLEHGDVLVTMGAGDITSVGVKVLEELSKREPCRVGVLA